jgi:8-oxo-dGTP diphosphatase
MPKSEQGVEVSLQRKRYTAIPRTLCFVTRGDRVLLLRGAPSKRIWANRYNGFGGHVERGEDIYASAKRELEEETGLTIKALSLRGVINVDAAHEVGILVFVFNADEVAGEPKASEEGTFEWVARDQLDALDLVEDLPAILPRIFDAQRGDAPFFAHTHYDATDRLVIRFADTGNTHAR